MHLFIGIILGILALGLLVTIHEFGHAYIAHKNGVTVKEFGIGFPPRLWSKTLKNGTVLSVNAIPLGGFTSLKGEYDESNEKDDYGAATVATKSKILLAGVALNWLTAIIIFTVMAFFGLPKFYNDQFVMPVDANKTYSAVTLAAIVKNSPAEKAGFESGDKIISVNNNKIVSTDNFISVIKNNVNKTISIQYLTVQNKTESKLVQLFKTSGNSGTFGAQIGQNEYIHSTWSAPIVGVVTTAQLTGETFKGVGDLFVSLFKGIALKLSQNNVDQNKASQNLNKVSSEVSGPIGILGVLFPAASQNITELMLLIAILSLSLACMNILPLPALDGGRLALMLFYHLRHVKLTKIKEERVQLIGVALLLLVAVLVTISDVGKIIR